MIDTLNIISAEQAKIKKATAKHIAQLINYAVTYLWEITQYHASGLILHIHNDTYFLSAPGANIRVGGYHYLIVPLDNSKPLSPNKPPPLNVPIHLKGITMNNFMECAMGAELGELIFNCQRRSSLINALN